jgi:DNA mismatch repair protein MutS
MIQFIHEHKLENLISLPKPIIKGNEKNLVLSHNCIYQLYLIPNKEHETEKYNSLLSILNKCDTAIGRRLCKDRLLYPILDHIKLKERYDTIEKFQINQLYDKLKPNLKKILDVEKLHRKMGLSLLTPYEFYSLHTSYTYLKKITNTLNELLPDIITENTELLNELDNYMSNYNDIFDLNELEKYSLINMSTSVFNNGKYIEIDQLQDKITHSKTKINLICDKLSKYIDFKKKGDKQNVIKQEKNDKYGIHFCITETRSKTFKKSIGNLMNTIVEIKDDQGSSIIIDLKDVKFYKKGSSTHIELSQLNSISNTLVTDQLKIQNMNKSIYLDKIKEFYHPKLFGKIVKLIGFIDLNSCLAKISVENVYSKPEIIDSDNSMFSAKGIRHPIVERIQTEIEYVPNDVSLSENGILLFGTNACGKSTLMKSIGLTLIMAQAGFYVPCSELKYSPYNQIFTRIINNDNIFKRQSSFAVEMSELRGILKRADKNSLVLGDEVCSGTETTSALSIVSAGLKTLSDLKCSFIFTSHLHQLMDIQIIKEIHSLKIYHLKIEYDPEKELLTYKRKLEEGSGPAIYGLEVCKALDLGNDFISLARKIQMEITNTSETLLNDKKSNYNTDILMDICQICKEKSEHTHHIKEQNEADSNGIIDHHHKNISHNLVPLCESCHHKVHNENLRIYGYHQTNEGIKLNYEYIDVSQIMNHKKKFSKKDLVTILGYKDDILSKQMKKSNLIKKLELDHHIQISGSTLNKILKGEY